MSGSSWQRADGGTFHPLLCYNLRMPNLAALTESPPAPRHALAHAADRLGATASFLCALHCAALPFVLGALPALGLGFLADHGFERAFIVCASALAAATLGAGVARHGSRRALSLLVPGLLLLWCGGFLIDGHDTLGLHAALVALGGSGVALAHRANLRLLEAHERGGCCVRGEAAIV